jgi:hypothetical protein
VFTFRHFRAFLVVVLPALLIPLEAATQQQLGHKVLGGVGINAGEQSEAGLYVLDRFIAYGASEVKDRDGNTLPIPGLDIKARGNMFGLALTVKPKHAPYFTVAAGVPAARISLNSDLPLTSIDRAGLGDAFVQPIKVGWRKKHFDAVASYSIYVPTGKFEPRKASVGRGFWTHQLSLGGAVFPKEDRRWRASVLGSYDINGWKQAIDIKRGNTLQVQGGAGIAVAKIALIGVAGFGLWQVTDDKGDDIPLVLRGLRTRGYGIGPELDVAIVPKRLRAEVRYEWEIGARSRPEGNVLVAGLSYVLLQPRSSKDLPATNR